MLGLLKRLVKASITPAETITDNELRERSRVFAIVTLAIIFTGTLQTGLEYLVSPQRVAIRYISIVALGLIGVSYLINRVGQYVVAAWLVACVGVIASYVFMFIQPVGEIGVSLLIITMLITGILLPYRHTAIIILIIAASFLLMVGFTPLKFLLVSYLQSIWTVLIAGFLVTIGLHLTAKAQHALRVSEQDVVGILKNMQDTYYRTDIEGNILKVSESISELLGFKPEELVGKPIASLLSHPDRQDTFFAELESNDGKVSNYEIQLMHRDGRLVWTSINSQHTRDDENQFVGTEGTIRNVSGKRAVEDLRFRFGRMLDQSHHEIYVFDSKSLKFMQVNYGALKNLGYSIEEMLKKTPLDIKPEFSKEQFLKLLQPLYRAEENEIIFETVHRRKDDTKYTVEIRLQLYTDEQAPVFIAMVQDVTERLQVEAHTRTLSMALQQAADAVIVTNTSGIIEYVNPAFEEVTGYSQKEATGKTPSIVRSGKHDHKFYSNLWKTISSGKVFRNVFINRRKNGEIFYEEKTITPVKDASGKIVNYISTGRDISERIESQERLHYLAHHDVLTDLPNRLLFLERLSHALTRAQRSKKTCAVLFLDLDRFKKINDTLGHDAGDHLLQAVGKRLKTVVREGDTIARFGGDEFIVLLEDIKSPEDIGNISRKILKEISQPFFIDKQKLFTSTSIGVSLFPTDGTDANTLMKNADAAMYRAKDHGRNNYQFYSADIGTKALEYFKLETGLHNALEREEFILHFQPQLDLNSGKFIGVETLIRWNHPKLGLVAPAEFIPLLEDTGMIVPVGEWALKAACMQFQEWKIDGIEINRLAINISSRQMEDTHFLKIVEGVLKSTKLDPRVLEFEITESLLMSRSEPTLQTIRELSDMGIRLAIDDFGTGYSSLSYLKRFPIDTLKIDQSFVRDVTTDAENAAIVEAILAMSRSLNIDVVAEGVETCEQETFLKAHGCDYVQGFYYAKPASPSVIKALLSGTPP